MVFCDQKRPLLFWQTGKSSVLVRLRYALLIYHIYFAIMKFY